jgi:CRP-like cAMP-binding protein
MENMPDPRGNAVLANLLRPGRQRWEPHLEPLEMTMGEVLYEPGLQSEYLYFPVTAVISLLYPTANGPAEIADVGNQGIVGVGLLLCGAVTPGWAVVRVAGVAFRLRAQMIRDEFNQPGPLLDLMLRYTQTLIAKMVHNIGRLSAI